MSTPRETPKHATSRNKSQTLPPLARELSNEFDKLGLSNKNGIQGYTSVLISYASDFWTKDCRFSVNHIVSNLEEFESCMFSYYKTKSDQVFGFQAESWKQLWEIIGKSMTLFQFSFLVVSIGDSFSFRADGSEPTPARVIDLIYKSKIHLVDHIKNEYRLSEQETKDTLNNFSDKDTIQSEIQSPLRCVFLPFSSKCENMAFLSKNPSIECVFSLAEGNQIEKSSYIETNRLNLACTILNETVNLIIVNKDDHSHVGFIGLDRKNSNPLGLGATFYIVPAENLLYTTIDVRRIRKLVQKSLELEKNFHQKQEQKSMINRHDRINRSDIRTHFIRNSFQTRDSLVKKYKTTPPPSIMATYIVKY